MQTGEIVRTYFLSEQRSSTYSYGKLQFKKCRLNECVHRRTTGKTNRSVLQYNYPIAARAVAPLARASAMLKFGLGTAGAGAAGVG